MDDIQGKVALVTGGSRGIGRAIALALGQAGADVAVNFRTRETEAGETAFEIIELGRRAITVQADVSKSAEIDRLLEAVEAQLGGVDILVNNAGVAKPQRIEEITERDFDELIAVNLKSCFLLTQAVLPGMRSRGWGRIINVSSIAAQLGGTVGPHYAASKAGMLGLTHSFAPLVAKEGVTVNAIAPALIETEMVTMNARARSELIPIGRFGTADEVASVAVLLAQNGFITGQTINVNGGWYLA
jgi:3-oxoacyl-[acyl-carrier protein] reductase